MPEDKTEEKRPSILERLSGRTKIEAETTESEDEPKDEVVTMVDPPATTLEDPNPPAPEPPKAKIRVRQPVKPAPETAAEPKNESKVMVDPPAKPATPTNRIAAWKHQQSVLEKPAGARKYFRRRG